MGTPGRKPSRKEEIQWSSNIAYAVGLIATDGCLSGNGKNIDLTSKDREQLENFLICIEKNVPISTKASSFALKPITHVQFSDVVLYRFFLSVGLTPRKSLTIGALKVPDEYFFDFLRGSYDGDGCFYSYFDPRWKSSFMFYLSFTSASPKHILWLRATIVRLCSVKGHVTQVGKRTLMTNLRYAKKEATIVLSHMYPSSSVLCLTRKRLKIIRALGIVGMSLVQTS